MIETYLEIRLVSWFIRLFVIVAVLITAVVLWLIDRFRK